MPESLAAAELVLTNDLRKIGFVPRVLGTGFFVLAAASGWVMAQTGLPWAAQAIAVIAGLTTVAASLRVRAWLAGDVLVVRSYFQTLEIQLIDTDFGPEPYEGWWNGFEGVGGWLNGNLYMIDADSETRRTPPLGASVCFRKTCERVVEGLNDRAEAARERLGEPPIGPNVSFM